MCYNKGNRSLFSGCKFCEKRFIIMKKLLSLVLCLMLALSMVSFASAEAASVEEQFDGTWVKFEDGFEIYLPSSWVEYECTEEMNASGIFYVAGTEDLSYSCMLGWKPLEVDTTLEAAYPAFEQNYPGANLIEVNGVGLIAYIDEENGLLNCVALDATEPGMYMFSFSPADDEDFQYLASAIASSIREF